MIKKPDFKKFAMLTFGWIDEGKRKLVELDDIVNFAEKTFERGVLRVADHIWDMQEFYEKKPDGRAALDDVSNSLYSYAGCNVESGSSRSCEKGTRACTVKHSIVSDDRTDNTNILHEQAKEVSTLVQAARQASTVPAPPDHDEWSQERQELKQTFEHALLTVGIHSDPESLKLSEAMRRWKARHLELKQDTDFYNCIACADPLPSWGMCQQCSVAWGIGRAEALNELGCSGADIPILFAGLAAMIRDVHAPQDQLSEEQWKRGEEIFKHFEKHMDVWARKNNS